jgi:cobalt/nickel transport system permease protein
LTAPRRALAAGVGAYVGINVAAFCAAVDFGVQPALFYKMSPSGNHVPLYSPFHLSQSIPAMLGAHLLVAGVVESVLTMGVIAYLQRANESILRVNHPKVLLVPERAAPARAEGRRGGSWAPVVGLVVMLALVPLGLLASGGAFGEVAPGHLHLKDYGLSAVPSGLQRYHEFWSHSLLPGYHLESRSYPTVGYYVSAVVGSLLIAGVVVGLCVPVVRRRRGAVAGERESVS